VRPFATGAATGAASEPSASAFPADSPDGTRSRDHSVEDGWRGFSSPRDWVSGPRHPIDPIGLTDVPEHGGNMTHGMNVILTLTSALVLGACASSAPPTASDAHAVPMSLQEQCTAANQHLQMAAAFEREARGMWFEPGVLEDQHDELLRQADQEREIARQHELAADRLASNSISSGGEPRCVLEQPRTS